MQVFLGSDHRGFELKAKIITWLNSHKISYVDFGPDHYDAEDDYNDVAKKVAQALLATEQPGTFGILICGSAQGMAMQANRFKGIRAAICNNQSEAYETRGHNDSNILCLSADTIDDQYMGVIDTFLNTPPLPDEKYKRRNQKLDEE